MPFVIKNLTASAIELNDIGSTIPASGILDIRSKEDHQIIADSTQIRARVTAGDITILDASGSALSAANASAILDRVNIPFGLNDPVFVQITGDIANNASAIDALPPPGTGEGTFEGASIGYHFLSDNKGGSMYDSWLGTTTRHIPSNESPYVMPFNGVVAAMSYTNSEPSSDGDFEVRAAPEGGGTAEVLVFRWEIRNGRVGRISSLFTAEIFTIDWTGITGASLPTGATPGAWFDVSTPDYTPITYRFWFSDGSTTAPAAGGTTLTAIVFTGGETDQAISDLVVAALIGADAEFAGAANGGTPLITTTMASKGEATDTVDGAVPTGAVFAVTTQGSNGPMEITVSKGDKIGILVASDPGGGVEPQDVIMSLYIQWADEPQEESIEDYVGNF